MSSLSSEMIIKFVVSYTKREVRSQFLCLVREILCPVEILLLFFVFVLVSMIWSRGHSSPGLGLFVVVNGEGNVSAKGFQSINRPL